MANASPIFDPAAAFTGRATGANLVGCRFVKAAAAKTDGNPLPISYAGATDHPVGVTGSDVAQDKDVVVYPGQVLLVEAGGNVAVGPVELVANGRVQTLASGRKCGNAWTTGTTGQFVLVQPIL